MRRYGNYIQKNLSNLINMQTLAAIGYISTKFCFDILMRFHDSDSHSLRQTDRQTKSPTQLMTSPTAQISPAPVTRFDVDDKVGGRKGWVTEGVKCTVE